MKKKERINLNLKKNRKKKSLRQNLQKKNKKLRLKHKFQNNDKHKSLLSVLYSISQQFKFFLSVAYLNDSLRFDVLLKFLHSAHNI